MLRDPTFGTLYAATIGTLASGKIEIPSAVWEITSVGWSRSHRKKGSLKVKVKKKFIKPGFGVACL